MNDSVIHTQKDPTEKMREALTPCFVVEKTEAKVTPLVNIRTGM